MIEYIPSTAGELALLHMPVELSEEFLISLERGIFGEVVGRPGVEVTAVSLTMDEFNAVISAWIVNKPGLDAMLRYHLRRVIEKHAVMPECPFGLDDANTRRVLFALEHNVSSTAYALPSPHRAELSA